MTIQIILTPVREVILRKVARKAVLKWLPKISRKYPDYSASQLMIFMYTVCVYRATKAKYPVSSCVLYYMADWIKENL